MQKQLLCHPAASLKNMVAGVVQWQEGKQK
jgi:hypothetical protein